MNQRWYDLTTERLEDGSIRLKQDVYGREEVIRLHPEQLLSIARQAVGMNPETAGRISELERRIAVLTDKLQNICCDGSFRRDLLDGCEFGGEYLGKLDGLLDLALEFDGGRLEAEE